LNSKAVKYNFDEIFDRTGTSSFKYDLRKTFFGADDITPMWVADMDFATPDFVREAIQKRLDQPIFGYTFRDEEYFNSIIQWFARRHSWPVEKDWIVFSPGILPALNLIVLALTAENDEIIVQSPVYYPFFTAVTNHKRNLVNNQLVLTDGRYRMNWSELEKQLKTAKMIILCNPHNPVGRAWEAVELERLAELCLINKVLILSDEVHSDLVLPGCRHQVMAALSDEVANITITTHAPSKTFNLAGLASSSIIISNEELRTKVAKLFDDLHVGWGNLFGMVATKAAFTHGDEWLGQLLDYVNGNIKYVMEFMSENLPRVKAHKPEATYMIWLDFNDYGLTDDELQKRMVENAKLGLSPGKTFGPGGEGFMRMNLACPRQLVINALNQIHDAFGD
jgi:cysteine-S-conjugate beta-lyase